MKPVDRGNVGEQRGFLPVHGVEEVGLLALLDAVAVLPGRADYFPSATSEHWRAADRIDPLSATGGSWRLSFRAFALRHADGGLTVIDLGLGPLGSPGSDWAGVGGKLPDALERAGIRPEDVRTVVLTHLHSDHVGWAVASDRSPMFPHAEYVVQQAEVEHLAATLTGSLYGYVVEPLLRHEQLRQVHGRQRLPGSTEVTVELLPTPGHTPGHQSVLLTTPRTNLLFTGDAFVHAVQLVDPAIAYCHDGDAELGVATRRHLLELTRPRPTIFASPHFGVPLLTVPGDGTAGSGKQAGDHRIRQQPNGCTWSLGDEDWAL